MIKTSFEMRSALWNIETMRTNTCLQYKKTREKFVCFVSDCEIQSHTYQRNTRFNDAEACQKAIVVPLSSVKLSDHHAPLSIFQEETTNIFFSMKRNLK